MGEQYRQGDVLLERIAAVPHGARCVERGGRVVLALGEATGHAHAVVGEDSGLFELPDGRRFLVVRSAAQLSHEEHAALDLEAGVYAVVRQREYVYRPEVRVSFRIVGD